VEADHATHSDGHVGIGGKVKIDLQHKGKCAHPQGQHRPLSNRVKRFGRADRIRHQKLIGQSTASIGQHRLFRQPHRKAGDTVGDIGAAGLALQQLSIDILIADNRAGWFSIFLWSGF
jgi:hypothetical protein